MSIADHVAALVVDILYKNTAGQVFDYFLQEQIGLQERIFALMGLGHIANQTKKFPFLGVSISPAHLHLEISEFLSLADTVGDILLQTAPFQEAHPVLFVKGQVFAPYPLRIRNGVPILIAKPETRRP